MEIAILDADRIKCVEKEAMFNHVKCCYEGNGFGNMVKHDVDKSCFHRAGVERLLGVLSGDTGRGGSDDINKDKIFYQFCVKEQT